MPEIAGGGAGSHAARNADSNKTQDVIFSGLWSTGASLAKSGHRAIPMRKQMIGKAAILAENVANELSPKVTT